ncbi:sensor histidine kinase [Bacillus sp. Bva_UNVM-123]|uniref:ATP-binding protein n=1 Tax=Bacillus sp. Bva_UNVM-123 TaxID=2829798 RepID=UPI00391F3427
MKEKIKGLPLFKKLFLFSFFICFIVVIATVGISLLLQVKQMEKQLKFRVVEMASLWSETIDIKDIENVKNDKDRDHPSFQRLQQNLTTMSEKAQYSKAILLSPEVSNNNEIFIIASADAFEDVGLKSLMYLRAHDVFRRAYNEAIYSKRVIASQLKIAEYGFRIYSFAPIFNQNGEIIAVLSISIDASVLYNYINDIAVYLIVSILIIMVTMYFILRRGLKIVMKPIKDIIIGFNELSKGNFSFKLESNDHPEFNLMIDQFNNMTSQLSELFERLSATSEQLGSMNRTFEPLHRFEDAIDEMDQILHKTKIQRELQKAEKMNAIGQLAASVAHEIRNPMTVVKGFLQIFLAKEEMSDEERMYVRLMLEEMNRAETIINDYLSLAKPDIEMTEIVDAGELAAKVIDLMNSYAMMSKNIQIHSDLQHNIFIKGNKGELTQVLVNIFKNGIEAMKDGGVLSLHVYKEKNFAVFEIGDTGIGMSEEELERLGTAFYSLKEKGTGIGLMVCYQIVERMKGKIEVKSIYGEGTVFKIFFPLLDE